ncbi:sigma 54-interacting transcriptional regulator [Acinetobacter sp. FL51]|jgi:two-component system response regulator HydG|uniref:sigma 54-interacting transcriptional regulator n=1 Tax=Acinetobacter sp. FL51 TaxID=2777978 RepID=UPI0018E17F7A|nr:sigma 54-interacting transcriptional regulator [Acinetobacter sp. FL51]MBI1453262.1 sigma 54-interacting transcriptional regulator [Acinetobacter sp. FL51]
MTQTVRLKDWDKSSPGISEISSRLRFSFETGQIWLDEERMMLMHSSSLIALRKELIETLGLERTRGILTRIGYAAGLRDAEIVKASYKGLSDLELLHKGPLLHALEGMVKVELQAVEIDIQKGSYFIDAIWENSIEYQIHKGFIGPDQTPIAWNELGHATGYVSGIMNRFILHKQVEITPKGPRFVGKPLEEWDDASEELKYYQSDSIVEQILALQNQVEDLKQALPKPYLPTDLIGESEKFKEAWNLAEKASSSTVTVLLLGETGVGKDVFANAIHNASPRADKPFVAVNCGALPNELIESELFGIEKGAFTGAQSSRAGRFERADGGTLFLDEVGELSMAAQTRLLRALQSGDIDRLGSTETRKVNVRVIAATNVDLAVAVENGTFRKDLYYRLNVFPVAIPPLKERKNDILALAQRFIDKFAAREGKRIKGLTDKAIHALQSHDWPGNIRELENVIERGIILAHQDSFIDAAMLFPPSYTTLLDENVNILNREGKITEAVAKPFEDFVNSLLDKQTSLDSIENLFVKAAIDRSKGNLCAAARLLGISRAQMGYKQKKLA